MEWNSNILNSSCRPWQASSSWWSRTRCTRLARTRSRAPPCTPGCSRCQTSRSCSGDANYGKIGNPQEPPAGLQWGWVMGKCWQWRLTWFLWWLSWSCLVMLMMGNGESARGSCSGDEKWENADMEAPGACMIMSGDHFLTPPLSPVCKSFPSWTDKLPSCHRSTWSAHSKGCQRTGRSGLRCPRTGTWDLRGWWHPGWARWEQAGAEASWWWDLCFRSHSDNFVSGRTVLEDLFIAHSESLPCAIFQHFFDTTSFVDWFTCAEVGWVLGIGDGQRCPPT